MPCFFFFELLAELLDGMAQHQIQTQHIVQCIVMYVYLLSQNFIFAASTVGTQHTKKKQSGNTAPKMAKKKEKEEVADEEP